MGTAAIFAPANPRLSLINPGPRRHPSVFPSVGNDPSPVLLWLLFFCKQPFKLNAVLFCTLTTPLLASVSTSNLLLAALQEHLGGPGGPGGAERWCSSCPGTFTTGGLTFKTVVKLFFQWEEPSALPPLSDGGRPAVVTQDFLDCCLATASWPLNRHSSAWLVSGGYRQLLIGWGGGACKPWRFRSWCLWPSVPSVSTFRRGSSQQHDECGRSLFPECSTTQIKSHLNL